MVAQVTGRALVALAALTALVAVLTPWVPVASAEVDPVLGPAAPPAAAPLLSLTPLTPPLAVTYGDRIEASVRIENTGRTAVERLRVGGASCPRADLPAGAVLLCRAVRAVTRADVAAGSARLEVRASADSGWTAEGSLTVPALPSAGGSVAVRVRADDGAPSVLGRDDVVRYVVRVDNRAETALRGLVASTSLEPSGNVRCDRTEVRPHRHTYCRFAHTVTQDDVDRSAPAGVLPARVVVAATRDGAPVTSGQSPLRLRVAGAHRLTARVVSLSGSAPVTEGDGVAVQVRVRNRGDLLAGGLSVRAVGDDRGVAPTERTLRCDRVILARGRVAHCEGITLVTPGDAAAGRLERRYVVRAQTPTRRELEVRTARLNLPVVPAALGLTRDDEAPPSARVGDRVVTTYTLTNPSPSPVSDLAVVTPHGNAQVACRDTELSSGGSTTCEGAIRLSRHDVDEAARSGGRLTLRAVATGRTSLGTVASPRTAGRIATATDAALSATLSTGAAAPVTRGDDLEIAVAVRNSGAVSVTDLTVGLGGVGGLRCPDNGLAPATTMTCHAVRRVTVGDVERGSIGLVASAHGRAVGAGPPGLSGSDGVWARTAPVAVPTSAVAALRLSTRVLPQAYGGPPHPGDLVTLAYTVRSVVDEPVSGIEVHDARFQPGQITCAATGLAPRGATRCTGMTVITGADADLAAGAGGVVGDTAVASGVLGEAPVASRRSRARLAVAVRDALTVEPLPDPADAGPWAEGTSRDLRFAVHNAGTTSLHAVRVRLTGAPRRTVLTCPQGVVPAGATVVCGGRVLRGAGSGPEGVLADALNPLGNRVRGRVRITPAPSAVGSGLEVTDAEVSVREPVGLGDVIAVDFRVTNTGRVRANHVVAAGGLLDPSAAACTPSLLLPGETALCRGTHTITGADLDRAAIGAGRLTAPVGAAARDGRGRPLAAAPVTVAVETDVTPGLDVVVRPDGPGPAVPGSLVPYRVQVVNTGGQSVQSVAVTSSRISGITCRATTLPPGHLMACTAVLPVAGAPDPEHDPGPGGIVFTASGTGLDGTRVTAAGAGAAAPTPAIGALRVDLIHRSGPVAGPGAVQRLDLRVTALGDRPVRRVVIGGDHHLSSCEIGDLAPGETTRCPATLFVTQDDVDAAVTAGPDAGRVLLGVRATGLAAGPDGDEAVASATRWVRIPVVTRPRLVVRQHLASGPPAGQDPAAGDDVPVEVRLTNTGGPTLTGVGLDAPALDSLRCPATPDASSARLAAGATLVCTARHSLTQDDVQAGSFQSVVSATASTPDGRSVPAAPDTISVAASTRTGLSARLTVTGVRRPARVGDVLTSTVVVANTGDKRVSALEFADALHPDGDAFTCTGTFLEPGEEVSCTAVHTVDQHDVDTAARVHGTGNDAPSIAETLTVAGRTGAIGVVSPSVRGNLPVDASAGLSLDVHPSPLTAPAAAGDRVPVELQVANSGQQSLSRLRWDTRGLEGVRCPHPTLGAGQGMTCTAVRRVRQRDVERGRIDEGLRATARAADGRRVAGDASLVVSTSVRVGLTVEGGPTSSRSRRVGEAVAFNYTVVNAGDLRVTALHLEPDGARPGALDVACAETELAPGARTTCTGSTRVTQRDVDQGGAHVGIRAVGGSRAGPVASVPVPLTITTRDRVGLHLASSPAIDRVEPVVAGDVVRYLVRVENTGDRSIEQLRVDGSGVAEVTCPRRTLASGGSTVCRAAHLVAQSEVDAGSVQVSLVAQGRTAGPGARSVASLPDVSALPASLRRGLDVQRRLEPFTSGPVGVGDPIEVVYDLTNTGDVTLVGLSIESSLAGNSRGVECGPVLGAPAGEPSALPAGGVPALPPGTPVRCSLIVHATQAQVDAGRLVDRSVVRGRIGGAAEARRLRVPTGSASLPTAAEVGLDVHLGVVGLRDSGSPGPSPGDRLRVEVTVTNTGDRTLRDVRVLAPEGVRCPFGRLGSRASATCHGAVPVDRLPFVLEPAAEARVTRDAGSIAGRGPAVVVGAPGDALAVTRRVAAVEDRAGDGVGAGDVVRFDYRVTGLSATTVRLDELTDGGVPVGCPAGAPVRAGVTIHCTAQHEVTTSEARSGALAGELVAAFTRGTTSLAVHATAPPVPVPGNREGPRFRIDGQAAPDADGEQVRWWWVAGGAIVLLIGGWVGYLIYELRWRHAPRKRPGLQGPDRQPDP